MRDHGPDSLILIVILLAAAVMVAVLAAKNVYWPLRLASGTLAGYVVGELACAPLRPEKNRLADLLVLAAIAAGVTIAFIV
ncbi:MAG TPA: hypothetical protein DCZ93_08555 [Elusimicrobia bacterium]|nr:hypothetical protein [Elusimicrobiota bacterium]